MEYRTFDQLRRVADVHAAEQRSMSCRERLERWAEVLEREPSRRLLSLGEIEYKTKEERRVMRSDNSPLTVTSGEFRLCPGSPRSDRPKDPRASIRARSPEQIKNCRRGCKRHGRSGPNRDPEPDVGIGDPMDAARGRPRQHAPAVHARAQETMRLTLGEFEKRDRVAKPVARQPFGPENGIVKRNRQGRVVRAHYLALFLRLVLDLSEGQQPAGRLALEHVGPALKALATRHRALFGGMHISNAAKLIKGPVFHRSSPSLGEDRR